MGQAPRPTEAMAQPIRRGGRGTLPDGAVLTWSLAEGGRGRRWRASRVRDGRLEGTILVEIDGSGRPARLELGTADGLLTLHPARGELELHGNVVTPDGIRHLRLDWSPRHELVVDGYPIVLMAAVRRSRDPGDRPAVIVNDRLECGPGTIRLDDLGREFDMDADGAPAGLDDAEDWPLEV
jgi:hypothetical protein